MPRKSKWENLCDDVFNESSKQPTNKKGQCTDVRFASFLSGGFTTMAVIDPPEKKWKNAPLCSVAKGDAYDPHDFTK